MAKKITSAKRRSRLSSTKQALLRKRLERALTSQTRTQHIPRQPNKEFVPLSFAQEAFWLLSHLRPDTPIYNRPVALRLTGGLNITVLEQTLTEMMQRHEILRGTFLIVDGHPVQRISPLEPISLPLVDLTDYPLSEREKKARELVIKQAKQVIEFTQGPFLRTTLIRLAEEDHVLLAIIPFVAFDGWSANIFVKELITLYEAFSKGNPSPLPELPIQYTDFAQWERQSLQGEKLERTLSYWREKLAGIEPLNLPTDYARPATLSLSGAYDSLSLSSSLLQSLKALSQKADASLFMTLLAAYQTLLYRYTGQNHIAVSTIVAGRPHIETEGVIGSFIKDLLLRTNLSDQLSFRELLDQVRKVTLEAMAHQELPLAKLIEELQLTGDLSHIPFQVMFNMENIPEPESQKGTLGVNEFSFDKGMAEFDLHLEAIEKDGGLHCVFTYKTDLFKRETIQRMMADFQTLLVEMIANPEKPIGSRF